jgi:ankyrin repeat protein
MPPPLSTDSDNAGLYDAAFDGRLWEVRRLIKRDADVNAPGRLGTPLAVASLNNHAEVMRILLGNMADVNAECGHYGTALQAASYGGHEEVVRMLLHAGADVNRQGGFFGNALQAASYRGKSEAVKMLLNARAEVNAKGGFFGNALQAASATGKREVVWILLRERAEIQALGRWRSALDAAIKCGQHEIVRILRESEKGKDSMSTSRGHDLHRGHGDLDELADAATVSREMCGRLKR